MMGANTDFSSKLIAIDGKRKVPSQIVLVLCLVPKRETRHEV